MLGFGAWPMNTEHCLRALAVKSCAHHARLGHHGPFLELIP